MDNRYASTVVSIPEEVAAQLGERQRRSLQLAAEAVDRFVNAGLHYGEGFADETGLKGQWCDIARKVGPLKRALWDGATLTRESPREILMDLIGHCLLSIEMLDREESEPVPDRGDEIARRLIERAGMTPSSRPLKSVDRPWDRPVPDGT